MGIHGKSYRIGLEIGSTVIRAAVLSQQGREFSVRSYLTLNLEDEGVLSEESVEQTIAQWLAQQGLGTARLAIGIPQYMATMVLKNLPPCTGRKLQKMVEIETSQLAGLSDEPFLWDYCPMKGTEAQEHPVLIGCCRWGIVEQQIAQWQSTEMTVADFAMNGIAMLNVFLKIHGRDVGKDDVTILLNLEQEAVTLMILADGLPVYCSCLLPLGERLEQACRQKRVGATLKTVNVLDEPADSPVSMVLEALDNDIQEAVGNWRDQEGNPFAQRPVDRIAICGGCCKVHGLVEWLERRLECPISQFGPKVEGVVSPEYAVAYGLGLQAAEDVALPISLVPPEWRWWRTRQKRWPWLAAAVLILVFAMSCGQGLWFGRLREERRQLEAREQVLAECSRLIPEIQKSQKTLARLESEMSPLVSATLTNQRLLTVLSAAEHAVGPKDFLVYLGDAESFHLGKKTNEQQESAAPVRSRGTRRESMGIFGKKGVQTDGAGDKPSSEISQISEGEFIAAGYAAGGSGNIYDSIRKIIEGLEQEPDIAGCDIVSGTESAGREDIYALWLPYLEKKQLQEKFMRFCIRVPFVNETSGEGRR